MMEMTHYMELLSTNQPWNLLFFMAIPVVLAETIAVSELYLLFTRAERGRVHELSKWAGIVAGVYFAVVFIYLFFTAVVPITSGGEWRGLVDFIAVSFYLLGIVPLGGIALLELGVIHKKENKEEKRRMHAIYVGIFLVTAHIAMIFGMLNPSLFSEERIPERGFERSGGLHRQGGDMPMHDLR